jgi:hypothetical protein
MLKNQQDVAVLKAELEYLDGDYWLCKCCSLLLTLVYREHGVILRPRWL